tara:strand:+ start:907 stop:2451 length:1545 start_codon:yes stop_codon:yes gene_type:complete
MLIIKNKNTKWKILIFLISILITSCTVNDKEAFDDMLYEAKKLFSNITKEPPEINSDNNEFRKIDAKKDVETGEKDKKTSTETVDDKGALKKSEIVSQKDFVNSREVSVNKKVQQSQKVSESKLIRRKTKQDTQEIEKNIVAIKKDNKKINVGVLLPLTGENKEIGKSILNALELALFQTDSSRINLIIKDTKADPVITEKIFKSLLDNKIKIFIGPLYSNSLASIQRNTLQKNVDLFALSNNTNLAKKGVWIFGIDPQQQTKSILNFLLETGNKKIGFLLPDNSYGYLIYDVMLKSLSGFNIKPAKVEFFIENIDSQRQAAKKISRGFEKYENYLKGLEEDNEKKNNTAELELEKPIEKPLDSIFIAASGQALTILASQLQYSNVDPKKVIYAGISSWEDESILQEPALNNSFFSATTDFLQEDIVKTYSIAYGNDMPKVAMVAYDILSLLSSVIKENGELKINYLLNENGYIGLRGLFRLKSNGIVERTFQIKTIENSKFKTFKKAPEFFKN